MSTLREHPSLWRYPVQFGFWMAVMLGVSVASFQLLDVSFGTASSPLLWIAVMSVAFLPASYLILLVQARFVAAMFMAMHEGHIDHERARQQVWKVRGPLLRFAIVGALVGGVLAIVGQFLEKLRIVPYLGHIASVAGAFAWATASFFVVPIIVLEGDRRVSSALGDSVRLARDHWGKTVTALATVSFVVLVPLMVFMMVAIMGMMLAFVGPDSTMSPSTIGLLVAAVLLGSVAISLPLTSALQTGFQTALYRYVRWDETQGAFDKHLLADAWK